MGFSFAASVPERGFDVTLDVPAGQTLTLLGPNGAGKSTLLSAAAGILRPPQARITLDGRPLTVASPPGSRSDGGSRRRRTDVWVPPHARGIGLLAQEARLFPHLTVLDNVAFGPRSTGMSRTAARETARSWLERVGLLNLADRRPTSLSGGQQQRAALARALAADPHLLLLDEPLAALDIHVASTLRHLLHEVLADRTAVIVTHDVLDALLLADVVAVIESGRVVEQGPAREVLSRPRSAFAAQIAGLNILTGIWTDGAVRTADGSHVQGLRADPGDGASPETLPEDGDAAVAVFRPSAVAVHTAPPGVGSPRNTLVREVTVLEPHGDLVRVRCGDLAADITPQSVADLALVPGLQVHLTIKAAETHLYPT